MAALRRVLKGLVLLIAAAITAAEPVRAADIAPADLDAFVRMLGFVETLPRHAPIAIGVVFRAGDNEAKTLAQRTALALSAMPGPRSSSIAAIAIGANELSQASKHLDLLFVLPGNSDGKAISEYARRQHVLSISSDANCLTTQCCAVMVRAGARTEIVLDSALAQETGANFSSVFMMMVKRK